MSTDESAVDRPGLRRAAVPFGEDADTLTSIYSALTDAISSAGRCWGNDGYGQQFAANYEEPCESTMGAFSGLADALEQIMAGVDRMASNHDDAEEAAKIV